MKRETKASILLALAVVGIFLAILPAVLPHGTDSLVGLFISLAGACLWGLGFLLMLFVGRGRNVVTNIMVYIGCYCLVFIFVLFLINPGYTDGNEKNYFVVCLVGIVISAGIFIPFLARAYREVIQESSRGEAKIIVTEITTIGSPPPEDPTPSPEG